MRALVACLAMFASVTHFTVGCFAHATHSHPAAPPPAEAGACSDCGHVHAGGDGSTTSAVPEPAPLLILLGTGWGLADHLIPSVSRVLAPIEGGSDWNHLSVRSAGAILLDRMFDRTAVTRRVGPA